MFEAAWTPPRKQNVNPAQNNSLIFIISETRRVMLIILSVSLIQLPEGKALINPPGMIMQTF